MEKLPQHILFVLFSYLPKVTDGTYNLIKYPETFISVEKTPTSFRW